LKIKRDFEENEYVKEITGKEFRESGALWFVNSILHLFGMAITWNPDTDELKASIVRFRGFKEELNDSGYKKLSNYLKDNIDEIEKECD
jgi:hypothetical protein